MEENKTTDQNSNSLSTLLRDAKAAPAPPLSESRVKVLVLGAKIDNMILKMLQEYLVMSDGDQDDLLSEGRPLDSFMLRVRLAARLGLISPTMKSCLKDISKIRNLCAHKEENIDVFSVDQVKSFIDNIWKRVHPDLKQKKEYNYEKKFEDTCEYILIILKTVNEKTQPIASRRDEVMFID